MNMDTLNKTFNTFIKIYFWLGFKVWWHKTIGTTSYD